MSLLTLEYVANDTREALPLVDSRYAHVTQIRNPKPEHLLVIRAEPVSAPRVMGAARNTRVTAHPTP